MPIIDAGIIAAATIIAVDSVYAVTVVGAATAAVTVMGIGDLPVSSNWDVNWPGEPHGGSRSVKFAGGRRWAQKVKPSGLVI